MAPLASSRNAANLLAARHFAGSDMAGIVCEENDIAGEERAVRAAEVQEHAVAAGDGDNPHAGYARRRSNWGHEGKYRREERCSAATKRLSQYRAVQISREAKIPVLISLGHSVVRLISRKQVAQGIYI